MYQNGLDNLAKNRYNPKKIKFNEIIEEVEVIGFNDIHALGPNGLLDGRPTLNETTDWLIEKMYNYANPKAAGNFYFEKGSGLAEGMPNGSEFFCLHLNFHS